MDAFTFIIVCLYMWMAIYIRDISLELNDMNKTLKKLSIVIDERGRSIKDAFYSRSADSFCDD